MSTDDDAPTCAEELSDDAIECRDLGHAWYKVRNFRKVYGPRGQVMQMTRQLQCARCGLPGEDTFNRGDMSRAKGRRHKTNEVTGYYLAAGSGRISRDEVRLEAVRRGLVDDDGEPESNVTNLRRKRGKRSAS